SKEPAWKAVNDRIIKEKNITVRARQDIPETGIVSNLEPGKVVNKKDLPDVELAPGVSCKMYWGKGVLINWMTMSPGAVINKEMLVNERLMVVWKGSVDQLINGSYITMRQHDTITNWTSTPHKDMVYIPKGGENAMVAGSNGAEVLEICWPVRTDYVKKAGGVLPQNQKTGNFNTTPSIPPYKIMNFYDVQFTDLSKTTANSRLISGQGFQCSFLSAEPGRVSDFHNHPEEQLSIVLRGEVKETVLDTEYNMTVGDIAYIPSDMVHRGEYSAKGCDFLDVFWPPRPDFITKMKDGLAKYHAIIPEDAQPVLVHNGEVNEPYLNFTEGPCWLDGRLYFSNMWFAADWSAGSPQKSNLIRMERDGSLKIIVKNMQTNGIMPMGNGNLVVCDMFGHRVVEMTPDGKVVRMLADSYDGVKVDGPNDLVIDAKGGIYFTDPQFTPGLEKTQPGKAVYYRQPNGKVIRVVNPGDFGQPNGILLSPDGKTCYINNTRNMPVGNYVMAFDVNDDGTLSNGRQFAKVMVPPEVREQEAITTGADGMTIDVHGNIYVATIMGLQIFDNTGQFIGIVHFPIRPVSCVFGGDDMQTIYCTCATRIYSIRTNVKGLEYPLK
ncbi:MAG: SMP-30/gluconolactonase/LRE family protein, partial [Candidatus Latescibacteria bacterium]|nr:SMP-30/gluconolactonase/LRE family protein [Candidatus Latescibacterota bacterium]